MALLPGFNALHLRLMAARMLWIFLPVQQCICPRRRKNQGQNRLHPGVVTGAQITIQ